MGIVGVGLALALAAVAGKRIPSFFLVLLGVLLIGYAFLGRGLAHMGYAPLYVGEAVLGVALVTVLFGRRPRLTALEILLLIFMCWGMIRTVPYLSHFGLDSLRDGVVWGYALFALAVAGAMGSAHFSSLITWYRRLTPIFVCWVPVAAFLYLTMGSRMPHLPGSDLPVIAFKGGDMAVHLAGVAAFIVVGLYSATSMRSLVIERVLYPCWLFAVAVAGSINRGALVTAILGGFFSFVLAPSRRWVAILATVVVIGFGVALLDPQIDVGLQRSVSIGQLLDNAASVVSSSQESSLQGTKDYRLKWWATIIGYTVEGPYFWLGKGFGINLADDDGFQVTADDSLRSPHNSHLTILARMGVPGFVMWLLLQGGFGVAMLSALLNAKRRRNVGYMSLYAWLTVYWLAAMINMSFDPYLEGPQGGIWFWSIFGAGLGALRLDQARVPAHRTAVPVEIGRGRLPSAVSPI